MHYRQVQHINLLKFLYFFIRPELFEKQYIQRNYMISTSSIRIHPLLPVPERILK